MCSFKAGDVVERVATDNGNTGARVGQRATVLTADGLGTITVTYGSVQSELWLDYYAKLVERPAHQFKVGDRGKTAINGGYEVLAVRNGCLLVEYTREGKVVTYNTTDLEGKVLGEQWLLPPARTTYWVTLRYDAPDPAAPGTQKLSELRTSEYATSGMRDVGISNISHSKGWSVVKQWEEEK